MDAPDISSERWDEIMRYLLMDLSARSGSTCRNANFSCFVYDIASIPRISAVGKEMIEKVDDLCMEESPILEVPHEPQTRTLITDSIHDDDVTETVEHNASSEILPQNPSKEKAACTSSLVPFPETHLLIHKMDASETICGKVERPTPVSVLERVYTEDVISPSSPQDATARLPMEAQVMSFDQCDDLPSGSVVPEVKQKDTVGQQGSNFEYVKTVLEASGLHHNETIEWKHFPQQLLNPSLFNEIEASSSESSEEWRFHFDCINEVLKELYEQRLNFCPRVSFVRPSVHRAPVGKVVVQEVQKGVERLLIPQSPKTIDEIIRKDIEKGRPWIDLCIHAEHISMEIEEIILEELIEEMIIDHCN